MNELRVQEMQDARILASLADDPWSRQEAIVQFVLGCAQMALDLRQMCDARRCLSHAVGTLEEPAALVEQTIAAEFRRNFGHPLFPQQGKNGDRLVDTRAPFSGPIDLDSWTEREG